MGKKDGEKRWGERERNQRAGRGSGEVEKCSSDGSRLATSPFIQDSSLQKSNNLPLISEREGDMGQQMCYVYVSQKSKSLRGL